MKRIIIIALCLSLGATGIAQNITCKKGKCTVDEQYLKELQAKAAKADQLEKDLAETQKALDAKIKAEQQSSVLKTFIDSASYAIGKDLYNNWTMQELPMDVTVVARSMEDCVKGRNNFTQKTMQPLLNRFQQEFERRQQEKERKQREMMPKTIEEGNKFLEANKNNKSIYTTASGLQYKIIKKGNGKKPTANDVVRIHYTGTLIDGTKFDSSYDRGEPLELPLNQVIPGWTEGVQLMDVGSHYMLYIPYNLGYGEQPAGIIPPGSALIFDVELLDIVTPKK